MLTQDLADNLIHRANRARLRALKAGPLSRLWHTLADRWLDKLKEGKDETR